MSNHQMTNELGFSSVLVIGALVMGHSLLEMLTWQSSWPQLPKCRLLRIEPVGLRQ